MRTLVTGFGPFLDVTDNPSARLAKGSERPFVILEVSYEAVAKFVNGLDPSTFDLWLMLGVAQKRPKISIETLGRNNRAGRDVRGLEVSGPIDPSLPETVTATLWGQELVAELSRLYPDELTTSGDAGGYLCNYLTFLGVNRFPRSQSVFSTWYRRKLSLYRGSKRLCLRLSNCLKQPRDTFER